ncbi:MAG TPA: glycosyltransferase, partial [Longimicrobiales bacterium]|nr:glycosyltransferase [Longimicrobiales bacterium]
DVQRLHRVFRAEPHVSLSNAQRAPVPWLNWIATVPHGLPRDLYALAERPRDYLAFMGRFSPTKGIEAAVEIAAGVGMPLRVAAKIGQEDRSYYERVVKRLLEYPLVEYVGEIGDAEKQEFLGEATAVLFPVDWPEPFGLVMIEAMACGTPVIAYPRGAVPEVVEDGVTGFLVEDVPRAIAAVRDVARLSRRRCRERFEERFTLRGMAESYLGIYDRLRDGSQHRRTVSDYRARGRGRARTPRPAV